MSDTSISVLLATPITAAMLAAGTTIAEPDTGLGEVLWVSAGTYAVGDERISDHKVYYCWAAHTGITKAPELDADHWLFKRPSNRFAPFDLYRSTQATATGSMVYEIDPGFFSAVRLMGIVGAHILVEVLDSPGGSVITTYEADLWEQAVGLWELLFGQLGDVDQVDVLDIPMAPAPRLRITISSPPSGPVALGMVLVGDWTSFGGGTGGTEYGGNAEPKSNSFIKFFDDGTFEIKRRAGFVDIEVPAVIDAEKADYCVALLKKVIDLPVAFSACNVPGYGYLNGFGLISATVTPSNPINTRVQVRLKGTI